MTTNKPDTKSIVRHKTNPFLEDFVVETKKKRVQISKLGDDKNIVLMNSQTGEITGTHVVTTKRVDAQEFVKLFVANIALTFDLNSAGIKTFNVLLWVVQFTGLGKDVVILDQLALDDFIENHPNKKLSIATFKRGISDLEKANIIAKTLRKGNYFINPNFVFNGDRIAFTTIITKKEKDKKEKQENITLKK